MVCKYIKIFLEDTKMIGNSIAYLLSEDSNGVPDVMAVMPWDRFTDQPHTVGISLRPHRLTHENILSTNKFSLSIPSAKHAVALNYCGIVSGREVNKIERIRLKTHVIEGFNMAIVDDCLSYYDCEVIDNKVYGCHTLFVALVRKQQKMYDSAIGLNEGNTPIVYYDVGKSWWCLGRKVWDYTIDTDTLLNALEGKYL